MRWHWDTAEQKAPTARIFLPQGKNAAMRGGQPGAPSLLRKWAARCAVLGAVLVAACALI